MPKVVEIMCRDDATHACVCWSNDRIIMASAAIVHPYAAAGGATADAASAAESLV